MREFSHCHSLFFLVLAVDVNANTKILKMKFFSLEAWSL